MKKITTIIFAAGLGLALAACGLPPPELTNYMSEEGTVLDSVEYGSETGSMLTDWEYEKVGCTPDDKCDLAKEETDKGCEYKHQMCHSKSKDFPNGYCEKWCPGENPE